MWQEILADLQTIESTPKKLKTFGLSLGGILLFISLLLLRKQSIWFPYVVSFGMMLFIFGLTVPKRLYHIQRLWMGGGIIIGFFVSRIILSILFYVLITPIGLLMRVTQRQNDSKRTGYKQSYWELRAKAETPLQFYKQQY